MKYFGIVAIILVIASAIFAAPNVPSMNNVPSMVDKLEDRLVSALFDLVDNNKKFVKKLTEILFDLAKRR